MSPLEALPLGALDQQAVLVILLAFGRVGGLIATMPLVSQSNVPIPVKAGLGLVVAALSVGALPLPPLPDIDAVRFGFLFGSEALLGLGMGFVVSLLLSVVDVAGSFIGMNSGLAVAMQFDPLSGGQSIVVTRIFQIAAFLTFFGLDLHHEVFLGLHDSFLAAPPGTGVLAFGVGEEFGRLFGDVLVGAVRISMPVVATAFFVNLVAALVTRFAQQMNIYFSVGLAAQAPLALSVCAFVIPAVIAWVASKGGDVRALLPLLAG